MSNHCYLCEESLGDDEFSRCYAWACCRLPRLSSPAGRPLGCCLGRSGARNSRPARCLRPADAFRTRHMVKLRRPALIPKK
eukprot:1230761-Prymnesium_polylepis.3